MHEWKRRDTFMALIAVCTLIGLFFLAEHLYVKPEEQDLATAEATLETERDKVATLESKEDQADQALSQSSRTAQQKLPVVPLLDQLFIGFERAQVSTETAIEEIEIAYNEEGVSLPDKREEQNDSEETPDSGRSSAPDTSSADEESDGQGSSTTQSGLNTIEFSIQLTAANYEEMLMFLQNVTGQARITQVSALEFEETEGSEEVALSVVLSSYYASDLQELAHETPQYDYGETPGKITPF
ncbi:hypothetical protein [Thalassobacillus sp. CUG 92003]|uniref:hypothetical protein n=1 Tax=Thalassobacillus sp. CUG 92003 TaxID=2736641 RepID=UPI0015E70EDF|nr:hypothetical protein [Thalassobacillus sp. CUG 92003]